MAFSLKFKDLLTKRDQYRSQGPSTDKFFVRYFIQTGANIRLEWSLDLLFEALVLYLSVLLVRTSTSSRFHFIGPY